MSYIIITNTNDKHLLSSDFWKKINNSLKMLQKKFSLSLVKYAHQILVLNILSLFIILSVLRFRQNGGQQRGFWFKVSKHGASTIDQGRKWNPGTYDKHLHSKNFLSQELTEEKSVAPIPMVNIINPIT